MSGYGLFQASTLGMRSQSHKLNTIGYNIANVNTGGFKRIDTEFETVLSDNIGGRSRDFGGVKPYSRPTNATQGLVQGTGRNLDLAISGEGFFSVQPELATSNQVYFTRDGSFQLNTVDGQTSSVTADDGSTITVSNGYLVDKNGMFVRGIAAADDGTFSTTATPEPMRVDQYAFVEEGRATTSATLEFNLPAEAEFGDTAETFTLRTYDSNAAERNITFDFSKSLTNNEWRVDFRADNLTTGSVGPGSQFSASADGATQSFVFDGAANTAQLLDASSVGVSGAFNNLRIGDEVTFAGTTSNNATLTITNIINNGSTLVFGSGITSETATAGSVTSTATLGNPLVFSQTGQISSPDALTFTATWDDGATSSFNIDIDAMTQFDGGFTPFTSGQDGFARADITSLSFDSSGHVLGLFSDGTERQIYKIPLYDFANPNALDSENGLLFTETQASGTAEVFFADENSKAQLLPTSVEISNVDIAQEFTRMIQTQNAYNMNATTFKTIDEMTTVARDLKA